MESVGYRHIKDAHQGTNNVRKVKIDRELDK